MFENILGDDVENLFYKVKEFIEGDWKPVKANNEKKYKLSLYNFLKDCQKKGLIKKDRLIAIERGENRVDIVIDKAMCIELKRGDKLIHQQERDRCVSQIKRMKNEYNHVLVVVVGKMYTQSYTQSIDLLRHELSEFVKPSDGIFNNSVKTIKVIEIEDSNDNPKNEKRKNEEEDEEPIPGIGYIPKIGDVGEIGFNL